MCNAERDLELDVLSGMGLLVGKSLVRREPLEDPTTEARFSMLESIHEYAVRRLVESGEAEALRRRHADYCVGLAEAAEPEFRGPRLRVWLTRLDVEYENLRAALGWSKEGGQVETGLRIAAALWRFWQTRGLLTEGRGWLDELIELAEAKGRPEEARIWAKALHGAGALAGEQQHHARALALLERALGHYRELEDRPDIARALNELGIVATYQGDYGRATALFEESLAIKRDLGDEVGVASSLNNLGAIATDLPDYERARRLLEEGLAIGRQLGDRRVIAASLSNLGIEAMRQGDWKRAEALHQESLGIRRELGDKGGLALALDNLADLAAQRGDHEQAAALCVESLELDRGIGDGRGMAMSLKRLAQIACRRSEFEAAALLFGMEEALRESFGAPLAPVDRPAYETDVAAVRARLGEARFTTAWAEGRMLPVEEAIGLALRVAGEAKPRVG